MKVSIITVVFNAINTIEKTIQSVLSQTYGDIEFIVIDGDSTDGTIDIINNYINSIDYFISKPDKGLYDAMNFGISMASGDLIGILNADDIFYSNNTISEIIHFHMLNNIDASVGNIVQKNARGKIIRYYSSRYWNPVRLKYGYMPPHPAIFFRRELFSLYGNYNLKFSIGSDYELIVRYFLANKISWKYSGITTTSMLLGGISSSGYSSYTQISKEINNALLINGYKSSILVLKCRIMFKLVGLIKAKILNFF